MVKHTPTIGRQQPTNCVSVFDNSVGLALKGLKYAVGVSHDKINISPAGIYMFKVSNENTRTMFEIFSKLTTKAQE